MKMISDQYDRGDADTARRLRRENVESSPPVAVPGSVPPGGVAGEDASRWLALIERPAMSASFGNP
jgi:hypothetical protein